MHASNRVTIALGITQTLAWGSTYYLPAILSAPIAADLGLSSGGVFAAFSGALLFSALLGPAVGKYIDCRGGRAVLSASNCVFAGGLLLLSLSTGAFALWLAWLVIGVGMAMGLYEAAFSCLTQLYREQARRTITGVTLIGGFASTLCWPITAGLEAELGWRTSCQVWAITHLVLGYPLNRYLIPDGRTTRITVSQTNPVAPSFPINLTMMLLAYVFAVAWFVSTAIAAHLPHLLRESGLTPSAAIAVAALLGPAQVTARFVEYLILRHHPPLLSAKIATLGHPLGALGVWLAGAPLTSVFVVLHGAGNGILTIAKGTLPLALYGAKGYGLRLGWLMAPARFGQVFAPFLFAMLLDSFGSSALLFSGALGLTAFLTLQLLDHIIKNAIRSSSSF